MRTFPPHLCDGGHPLAAREISLQSARRRLPTLVWFSGTWCHFCHHMSDFAYPVAEEFKEQLAFVEKSVDHDREAAHRFRIRGTPTFVFLDPSREEVGRFSFQNDAEGFRQAIEAALGAYAGNQDESA